jgi:hypothetical protein
MFVRSLRPMLSVGIAVVLAACGGSATPPPQTSGAARSSAGSSVAGPTAPSGGGGGNGFEGSLTTSKLYPATWTVAAGVEADPFNSTNNASLSSDKGTFGNIRVKEDGSVSFGSGATELSQNGAYTGTGATVTLDASGQFVCAFTIDTDLKGATDQAVLHIAGSMTVHWHPEGLGGLNCP